MNDPHSMLSLYRRLIQLRKSTPRTHRRQLSRFEARPKTASSSIANPAQHLVVALNFTDEPREIAMPAGKILLSTIARSEHSDEISTDAGSE